MAVILLSRQDKRKQILPALILLDNLKTYMLTRRQISVLPVKANVMR